MSLEYQIFTGLVTLIGGIAAGIYVELQSWIDAAKSTHRMVVGRVIYLVTEVEER